MDYVTILNLRKKYKISQIKLAEISGYTPAMISSWELKKAIPSDEALQRMMEALNKTIADIESNTFDIRKKRIQKRQDNSEGRTLPTIMKTEEDYRSRCNALQHTSSTPYVETLHTIYCDAQKEKAVDNPKTIALFSGCGGMSLGFDAAGYQLVGHLDIEDSANHIYEQNFPSSDLLGTDICGISDESMNDWEMRYGKIDVIIGGPPCQGFSLAGKRNPEDARNQLYKYYVHMVSVLKPKVFVMENVRLLTSMKTTEGHLFIDDIMTAFDKAGYTIYKKEINVADYGVPQTRERVILVGVNRAFSKVPFVFPDASHGTVSEQQCMWQSVNPFVTFRDATNDLQSIESGDVSTDPLHWAVSHPEHVIDWLKDVPEGCSAHDNEDPAKRPPSGFNTTYKRITWDEPCSTISTNFSMISGCRNVHPQSTRSLTIREAARAQSFPDEFVFTGKWGDIRKAIGNAVPPLFAKVLADAIFDQYFKR